MMRKTEKAEIVSRTVGRIPIDVRKLTLLLAEVTSQAEAKSATSTRCDEDFRLGVGCRRFSICHGRLTAPKLTASEPHG
jgi:hypothetical protein